MAGGDLVGFMEGATRVRNRKALVGVGEVEPPPVVEEGTRGHMRLLILIVNLD